MTDTTVAITTAGAPNGTPCTVKVGAPLNTTYASTITNNAASLTIPESSLDPATIPSVDLTVEVETDTQSDAENLTIIVSSDNAAISPPPNTTLSGSSQVFTLTPNVSGWTYGFWIGSVNDIQTANSDYFNSGALTSSNVITATGLPTDGRDMYLRTTIDKQDGNGVVQEIFTFTAATIAGTIPDYYNTAAGSFVWEEFRRGTSISNSDLETHQYSTMTALNADETLLYLPRNKGRIYNLATKALTHDGVPYGLLGGPSGSQNNGSGFWDKDDPDVIWGAEYGDTKITKVDIGDYAVGSSNPPTPTLVYQDPSNRTLTIGKNQSMPDANQRYVGVEADRHEVLIIDLTTGTLVTEIPRPSGKTINRCAISPSGDYVMVLYTDQTLVFHNAQSGAQTGTSSNTNHGDWVVDGNGKEWWACVGNPPGIYDPVANTLTGMGNTSMYGHTSGLAVGWVLMSGDNGGGSADGPILALVGDNIHTDGIDVSGSLPDGGWISGTSYASSQMRPSISRSGKYIVAALCDIQTNVVNVWLGTYTPA